MFKKIQAKLHNLIHASTSPKDKIPATTSNRAQPQKIRAGSLKSRSIARGFGGKALTGTKRQKEWGEDVRAKIVKQVTPEIAQALCNDDRLQSARFWINNRGRSPEDFSRLVSQQ